MQNEYSKVLALFAKHFTASVWQHAQVLLTGAILARGQRTVAAVLRVMGLSDEQHFVNYHRVLNRAVWSSLALSQTLLQLLVQVFAPRGPIVIGGDDTIERQKAVQEYHERGRRAEKTSKKLFHAPNPPVSLYSQTLWRGSSKRYTFLSGSVYKGAPK